MSKDTKSGLRCPVRVGVWRAVELDANIDFLRPLGSAVEANPVNQFGVRLNALRARRFAVIRVSKDALLGLAERYAALGLAPAEDVVGKGLGALR